MKRWDVLAECLLALCAIAALAAAVRADDSADPLPPGASARLGTSLLRHTKSISALAFSGDGKLIISGSWDRSACIWEIPSGRLVARFNGHKDGVSAAAISADGSLAASGDMARTTVLWDARSGKELHRIEDNQNTVFWLRFSADAKHLVWASGKTVRIWDVAGWSEEHQIELGDGARPVVLWPDGSALAIGCESGAIRIYNLADATLTKTLEGHKKAIFSLALSANGKQLLSGGMDNTVRLWDIAGGTQLQSQTVPEHWVRPTVFLNSDKTYAAAMQDGTVRFWDTATGSQTATLRATRRSDMWIMSMAVSPDGKTLATAGSEYAIRLWDAKSLAPIGRQGHTMDLNSIAFLDHGKTIATASDDGSVGLWNASTGQRVGELGEGVRINVNVASSSDGQRAVLTSENPSLEIFSGKQHTRIREINDRLIAMHGVAMSGDGSLLAACLRHDTIRVIETDSGIERYAFKVDARQFANFPVVLSADGQLLACGSGDPDKKYVSLYYAPTGQQIAQVDTTSGESHSLAFSPDGLTLAAASRKEPIRLFEVATGKLRATVEGDTDTGTCVAFSRDGRWIAAGGGPDQPTVRVWSLPSGKLVKKFVGQKGWIKAVEFSPDSKHLLSASHDTTAILWDVSTLAPPAATPVDEKALTQAWTELASADPAAAYRAIQILTTGGPTAAAFVAGHLTPDKPVDAAHVQQLISQLDADAYTTRQAAQKQLEALAESARPLLAEALKTTTLDETRSRLSVLLKRLDNPAVVTPETLRAIRAIEVLEHQHAIDQLKALGAQKDTLTGKRAQAVLSRLGE